MQPRILRPLCLLALALLAGHVAADDWPQWLGPQRDGIWREDGIVETLPAKLEYAWRTEAGMGYSGPAVANGKVYLTDRLLDAGNRNPDNPFSRGAVGGVERVRCLGAKTGEVVWEHTYPCKYTISYPAGPRATPTIHDGKVYSVGAMGDFFCLDAESGRVIWQKNYVRDYGTVINTWGMSAAPLIDGDRLILLVGGQPNACVVALDRNSGEEIWKALEADDPGYAPPMIFEVGSTRQLIIWTPQEVAALVPETGELLWSQPFAVKAGLSIPTPRFDAERNLLLVTSFYNGSMMLRLDTEQPGATVVWQGESDSELPQSTDGLHSIMCTPYIDGNHFYGVGSYGELRCLELLNGERVWSTNEATGDDRWWNAFLIPHEPTGRTVICNEQGDLIFAKLSPEGYEELDRAFLIEPTNRARRRKVVWSHPAFANRCVYARNDKEMVCVDLGAK